MWAAQATPLDLLANINRTRRKSEPVFELAAMRSGPNLVELAHAKYHGLGHEAALPTTAATRKSEL